MEYGLVIILNKIDTKVIRMAKGPSERSLDLLIIERFRADAYFKLD